ncbi:hypothetical protein KKG36_02835, partial [Patescibacteria group bacterium]|nr:hypothetical protein [Patescibacteria group bacterium]
MKKEILLGDDAIVAGALDAGVNFVSGYPGCPSAEIGQGFQGKDIHFEWSSNEKTALEAAIGASFSGLKSLVNMKSFGLNVCSDSLFPLAYTGTKAPMVIVVADDPSCWSSAQSEQDSRGYAYISHIPVIEPADVQECYDFTRFAFEMSEKFNTPVILRITTRVAHQRAIVLFEGKDCEKKMGEFTKNPYQFCTMPPRILEMKKELLAKLEKIRAFGDKANRATKGSGKIGIIATGVSYFHTLEALKEMNLNMPVLKIGTFYPLNEKRILSFAKNLKKILVVEELDDYLEREVKKLVKAEGTGIKVGELNSEKIGLVIAKLLGKTYKIAHLKENVARRYPKLCSGCPHLFSLDAIRKAVPEGTIFAGDIGCYMIAGYPPHNMQDFLFSMS